MKSKIIYLIFIVATLFVLMPKFQYPGDPDSIRIFSKHFLETGRPYLQGNEKSKLGPYISTLAYGGNYFVNTRNGNYFSKWGVFNVILFSIPELLSNNIKIFNNSIRNETFFLNLFNIAWLIVFILSMHRLLESLDHQKNQIYIYTTLIIFCTYLWYFIRAQSTEIFIITLFSIFAERFYKLSKFKNQTSIDQYFLFTLLLLILVKNVFILLIPICYLALIIFSKQDQVDVKKVACLWGLAFGSLCLLLFLINYWQFGDPLETGYSQQATVVPNFSFQIGTALYGFIFSNNRSIFVHFPIFLISLAGLHLFYSKHPRFTSVMWIIFIIYLGFFSTLNNWEGERTYGPRFLIFILPIISIPVVHLFNRKLFKFFFTPFLLFSIFLQYQVISKNFMASHSLRYFYKDTINNDEIDQYFVNNHTGIIIYHLKRMEKSYEPDFIYSYLLSKFGKGKALEYVALVKFNLKNNFFWDDK